MKIIKLVLHNKIEVPNDRDDVGRNRHTNDYMNEETKQENSCFALTSIDLLCRPLIENMSEIKDKIRKLLAHAESEKKIGNRDAASAYRKKAESLLRTNNLTRKSLKEPQTFHVGGEWICSCGAKISLDLQCATAGIAKLANMILAPHYAEGHQLRKTA